MKNILLCLIGSTFSVAAQTVPVIGNDSTLEVANWNIQWFGNTTGGPANENLQQQNVAAVIGESQIDLWGLAEVSDATAWDTLLGRLPQYQGVISTWNQTQRTALLFRKSMFSLLYQKHPLAPSSYDFAAGRLPLEVGLEADMGAWKDTLVVIVIHMKANTGDDIEKAACWQRRKNAALALKSYVEGFGQNRKCMVIGDWNDDMDSSVFTGNETPYLFWTADTGKYYFPTLSLSLAKEKSMEAFTEVIDHQCVYGRLKADAIHGSEKVFNLKNNISNYAGTTSDHYPVYSFFRLKKSPYLNANDLQIEPGELYWDGSKLLLSGNREAQDIQVFDMQGRRVANPFSGLQMVRYRCANRYFAQYLLIP